METQNEVPSSIEEAKQQLADIETWYQKFLKTQEQVQPNRDRAIWLAGWISAREAPAELILEEAPVEPASEDAAVASA